MISPFPVLQTTYRKISALVPIPSSQSSIPQVLARGQGTNFLFRFALSSGDRWMLVPKCAERCGTLRKDSECFRKVPNHAEALLLCSLTSLPQLHGLRSAV